jgi:hypothetical protein
VNDRVIGSRRSLSLVLLTVACLLAAPVPARPSPAAGTVETPARSPFGNLSEGSPVARSVDLVAYQATRKGAWFSVPLASLPTSTSSSLATFSISTTRVTNRRGGHIAPTLIGSYFFLQFGEVTPELFEAHAGTARAVFIRSASLFLDYGANRALDWNRRSAEIPIDLRGLIAACNARHIPVYLELNYSDYVPGPLGTGLEALVKTDNAARTISFLAGLEADGLRVAGVTFGDEWDDDAGFGKLRPTTSNSDLVGRFIAYATALKARFPTLKVYAFDSFIRAARGSIDMFWAPLRRIRAAEVAARTRLLDGFTYRESYVYIDGAGRLRPAQRILDDTESLYRSTPVYRYDVRGNVAAHPDRDELHILLAKTKEIFGRTLDLGLTEYLPAGPIQISESDTSRYADIDFILHYADVVGIYATLGLDVVGTFMFADSTQQAEAYLDRFGHEGLNYPVREQLAINFSGDLVTVARSLPYDTVKVKVYAARSGSRFFVMILNKDVSHERTVRVRLASRFDLTIRLPRRSYVSLISDGTGVTVSGIGS